MEGKRAMKQYGYGVDVGGTFIKFGLLDREGTLLDQWQIPTDASDEGTHLIPGVAGSLLAHMQSRGLTAADLFGIGLGVPSPVDQDGWVVGGENTGWGHRRLDAAGELQTLMGVPVRVENDGNVAALGELWKGAGRGCRNLVMITLGTAVGGGILCNGAVVSGRHGAGGEIGSLMMTPDEPEIAVDGKGGCLEQYVSATGLVRKAKKVLAEDARSTVLRERTELTAKDILDAAKAGDAVALEILEFFGEMMGRACSMISCVADPEVFLIGGGVSKAGEILLDVIRKYYRRYAFFAFADTEFRLAELGNDAGIYGCCYLAMPEEMKGRVNTER